MSEIEERQNGSFTPANENSQNSNPQDENREGQRPSSYDNGSFRTGQRPRFNPSTGERQRRPRFTSPERAYTYDKGQNDESSFRPEGFTRQNYTSPSGSTYNRSPRPSYNRYGQGHEGYERPQRGGYNPNYQRNSYNANRTANSEENGNSETGDYQQTNGYQRNGYAPRSGYNNQRGGYNNPRGGYNNQRGGYNNQRGGYNPHGGYSNQRGGYNPHGGYNNQRGGYNPRGGYNNQRGGYNQRPYNNQYHQGGSYSQNNRFSMKKQIEYKEYLDDPDAPIRLNKFLANAGMCSRREADQFIQAGVVTVNGQVVTELGTKVQRTDTVHFHDQLVSLEKKVYVLLNKPKDYVTTSDDPQQRKTVMELVKDCCRERIYPVGRLDRNTTGVLLFTNDGELASKLTHPKYQKKKIYHVFLDKNASSEDLQKIADGVTLEDGEVHADAISFASDTDKKQVGIEIHSGKNRIVRRIFESLGYRVLRLDRVMFAGLTKKGLKRGDWRFLTQQEVAMLHMDSYE